MFHSRAAGGMKQSSKDVFKVVQASMYDPTYISLKIAEPLNSEHAKSAGDKSICGVSTSSNGCRSTCTAVLLCSAI